MRRALTLITLALLVVPATATASTTLDLRGTYHAQGDGGGPYTITFTDEDCAAGTISGTATGGIGPERGTIDGNQIMLHEAYAGSYKSDITAMISADVTALDGTFHDSNGTTAPWHATRTSGPPAGCDGSGGTSGPTGATGAASATQVSCNAQDPDSPTEQFVCTATVGDASGAQPQRTPSGSVAFAIDPGRGGTFTAGDTCTLMRSSSGPTAFCSVVYQRGAQAIPPGTQPPLTATYRGDATFASSSSRPMNQYAPPPDPTTTTTTPPPPPPPVPDPLVASISDCSAATTPNDQITTPLPPARPRAAGPTDPLVQPTVDDPYCTYRVHFTQPEKDAAGRWADYYSARSADSAKASGSVGLLALGATQIPEPFISKGAAVLFGATAGVIGIRSAEFATKATQESAVNHDPPDAAWRTVAAPPRVSASRLPSPPGLSRRERAAVRRYELALLHETADQICMTDTINRATTALGNHDVATSHRQYLAGQACAIAAARLSAQIPKLVAPAQRAISHALQRLPAAQLRRILTAARKLAKTAAGRRTAAKRTVATLQRVIALPAATVAQMRTDLAAPVTVPQRPSVQLDAPDAAAARLLAEQTAHAFAAAAATSGG